MSPSAVAELARESGVTIVLGLVVLVMLVFSFEVSDRAAAIPRAVLVPTFIAIIARLVLEVRGRRAPAVVQRPLEQTEVRVPAQGPGVSPLRALGWLGGGLLAVAALGMPAGPAAFCFSFLRWHAGETWIVCVGFAAAVGLVAQALFGWLLV